jgi:hypothetical protein
MSKVTIIANAKTGALVSVFESNPEYGFVQLQQTKSINKNGFMTTQKRTTLLRGKVEDLKAFVAENPTRIVEGRLIVKEYTESDMPETMVKSQLNKKLIDAGSYEEALAPYVKKTSGDNGECLTLGGERIVRFTIWDQNEEESDVLVHHDNQLSSSTPIVVDAEQTADLPQ